MPDNTSRSRIEILDESGNTIYDSGWHTNEVSSDGEANIVELRQPLKWWQLLARVRRWWQDRKTTHIAMR